MKRIVNLIQVILGGIGLAALVVILNGMFQQQVVVTVARRTPTVSSVKPTPKATKPPKADWENATLEQIKFGKARTVLTHNGRMRIWSWLPDNRRLLLDLEDPETKDVAARFHIVTLDTKTGEIVEYGLRPEDDEPPLWIEQTQSVVFRYWNSLQGEPPEIRVGQADGLIQRMEASGLQGINVRSTTGNVYYLLNPQQANPLRMVIQNPSELLASTPFASLSLPTGKPRIDFKGRYLAIVGRPDLPVLDLVQGELHTDQIAVPPSIEEQPLWAQSGTWSPTSQLIGLILGQNSFEGGLLSRSELRVLRLDNSRVQVINLPAQFVMEFEWSPKDKFIIARGTPRHASMDQPELFWLIDVTSGKFKRLPDFLQAFSPEETFMAWSPKGQLAWIKQDKIMVSKVAP